MSLLQQEIERSFGDGPEHRPVELRVEAGRRALRRRRVAATAAALGVVTVLGIGYVAVGPGTSGRANGLIAVDPTPTPSPSEPTAPEGGTWEDNTPVRYVDGELEIREGVVVHERIENPYDYEPPRVSDALDLTFDGQRLWLVVDGKRNSYGYSSTVPSNGWASFADWVSDQADGTSGGDDGWPDTMRLSADGRVVPTPGTTVHNRTDDPQLGASFAEPGTPTGAAVVSVEGDEKGYFIVWRVIDGELDVITTPPNEVTGATFDELLEYARSQYANGEGLR